MLIIPVKEGEPVERAIKRFKKKFEKIGVMKELRDRKHYTKPAVRRRSEKLRAIYREQYLAREQA